MNSITKIFSGYNKLPNPNNHHQNHTSTTTSTQKPAPRSPLIAAVISLALLLTLTLAALLLSLIHESSTEPPDSPSESLAAVCSVTLHPSFCISSITTSNNNSSLPLTLTDPELIFTLSLKSSLAELQNLTSLPQTLISKANDARSRSALEDCGSLFGDAVGRLGEAVRAVEAAVGPILDEGKMGDLNVWISAAMTCEDTCLDGLEEAGEGAVVVAGEVRERVRRSKECLSNSLAILVNMESLLRKFHLTLH